MQTLLVALAPAAILLCCGLGGMLSWRALRRPEGGGGLAGQLLVNLGLLLLAAWLWLRWRVAFGVFFLFLPLTQLNLWRRRR